MNSQPLAKHRGQFLAFGLAIGLAVMSACAAPQSVPMTANDDLTILGSVAVDTLDSVALMLPNPLPPDESLLEKLLRSHPTLGELEDLWVAGGSSYAQGELDLAEEYFYVLRERVRAVSDDQPDSLATLYLGSLDRKLDNFIEILVEERFFAESYAPRELALTETFDSLRVWYDVPEFMLPKIERSDFEAELLLVEHAKVEKWMTYFTGRGKSNYQRWLDRRARVGWVLEQILEEEELPTELIALSMIESGLQAGARSRAAAVGWWQFVSGTARTRGLTVNEWLDERRDIERSTRAAARHLKLLHGMFSDWPLALAAYNAGEYRIQRAIGLQGDPDYWQLRLPRETRDYVPKFIAAARIAKDPSAFGFTSSQVDTLRFDSIELDDTFSLDQIAKAGGFSSKELQALNPQLIAACTPPRLSTYRLRVPAGRGEATLSAVAKIPEDQRITWRKHRVRSGETLGQLARRYRTSVRAIMDLNGIADARRVRTGRQLTIPYPRGAGTAQQVARGTTAPKRSNAKPGSGQKQIRYRIRSGDTLSNIAETHGISMRSIRNLNGVRGSRIRAGQELILHVAESFKAPPDPFNVNESTHERTEYKIRRGDTLTAISRRFKVDIAALLAWNKIDARATLRPGDRLSIWRPRTAGS